MLGTITSFFDFLLIKAVDVGIKRSVIDYLLFAGVILRELLKNALTLKSETKIMKALATKAANT